MKDDFNLKMVFDRQAQPISIDFGNNRIVRAPFSKERQIYHFLE